MKRALVLAIAVLSLGSMAWSQTEVSEAMRGALESSGQWFTSAESPWTATTKYSADEQDAAQSGETADGGETWLETVVTGPAMVDFWWRVWSEPGFDYLELTRDGGLVGSLTGDSGWRAAGVEVPGGTHYLRWRYRKDESESLGLDRGWLDGVRVRVVTAPLITAAPQPLTVFRGEAAIWHVEVESAGPVTYQWKWGDQTLLGETNSILTLPDVQGVSAGEYTVVVGNVAGEVTSEPAELTVLPLGGRVGYFSDQATYLQGPMVPIIRAGLRPEAITNLATADLSRLDILMVNVVSDFQPSGELLAHVPILKTWVEAGGRLVIHDQSGGAQGWSPLIMGSTNTVLVRSPGYDLDMIQPATTLVTSGPAGELSDTALDGGGYSYEGFALRETLPLGARAILGVGLYTNQVVGFSYPLYLGRVYYAPMALGGHLEQTIAADPFTRNLADVYVPNLLAYLLAAGQYGSAPALYREPIDRAAFPGETIRLEAFATGTPPLSYQWYRDGVAVVGATRPVLTLTNLQVTGGGAYGVMVSNAHGAVTSEAAVVSLREPPRVTVFADPSYVQVGGDPAAEASNVMAALRFMGHPVASAPILEAAYASPILWVPKLENGDLAPQLPAEAIEQLAHWIEEGGTLVVSGSPYDRGAALLNALLVSTLSEQILAGPFLRTADTYGSELSDDPSALPGWSTVSGLQGTDLASVWEPFYVVQDWVVVGRRRWGLGQVFYMGWDFDGASPRGTADGGWLEVMRSVLASTGSPPSSSPLIEVEPRSVRAVDGGRAMFEAEVYGSFPLNYQWFKGEEAVLGGTNVTLGFVAVSSGDAGIYHLRISNAHGEIMSREVTLTLAPAGDEEFRILALGEERFVVVDHEGLTGDDHGGIAVSGASVWVTGEGQTARFDSSDLGRGVGIGWDLQTLVSDLRTETAYLLGNGTQPASLWEDATTLIELSDTDGLPTDRVIELSAPVTLAAPGGIFAGYGRVVLWLNGRVYDIALPSGQVRERGALRLGSYQASETWAIWGVAEFFDEALHLVYVQDPTTIVRHRVPDGAMEVVQSFANLGDMASITVSPSLGRWYFHHEGSSQFGGGFETLGYAEAEFAFSTTATAPTVVTQPYAYRALVGGSARFEVRVSGTRPLTYQWLRNGEVVSGGTNAVLALAGLTGGDAGTYAVSVSNAFGITVSSNALLEVREGVVAMLFSDPAIVGEGGILGAPVEELRQTLADLGVEVRSLISVEEGIGGNVLLIPAQRLAGLGDRLSVPGTAVLSNWTARGGTLIVHGGSPNHADGLLNRVFGYHVLEAPVDSSAVFVQGGTDEVFGGGANWLVGPPYSTALWTSALPEGAAVYQAWDRSLLARMEVGLGQVIFLGWDWDGSTGEEASANGWSEILRMAVLSSGPAEAKAPVVLVEPVSVATSEGRNVRFSVGVLGEPPLVYQWWRGETPITWGTNSSLTLSRVTTNDAGVYWVTIGNAVGTTKSGNAVLTVAPGVGDAEFMIVELGTEGVMIQDHDWVTGDDRGGIALSSAQVFVTGDWATARLNAQDLSGGTSLEDGVRDTMVSDLATETVYLLADDAGYAGVGALASRLLELDGVTGSLTGSEVALSRTIPLAWGGGLFSGVGRVVVWTGGHVYDVRLPQGEVEDLGEMALGNYSSSENWAVWGVAEYFDNAVHLAYVQDWQTIVRRRVPDGDLSVIGTYASLGDMASFTVSLSASRWYFHYESGNQFGGMSETVGFAGGEFSVTGADPSPRIVREPVDVEAVPYGDVELSMVATGAPPLAYQWWRDGVLLEGATQRTLTLSPVGSDEGGVYRADVSNRFGVASSAAVRVNVTPLPAEDFQVISLGTVARVVEHSALTGDDRGGIAASAASVYVTGDISTASLALSDLRAQGSADRVYDTLLTDLRTATVYVLGEGSNPGYEGSMVNTLIELDGETGAPNGRGIRLTLPFPLIRPGGIFAGYGQVLVVSGDRIYHIALPSGATRDLGPFSLGPHTASESWAIWGLAEFYEGAPRLVYVRDPMTIVRCRVPDGEVSELATFTNLGDMANLTASVELGRWYFHYQGEAQFGYRLEATGYAPAEFSLVSAPRAPSITVDPGSVEVVPGGGVILNVAIGGTRPFSYQWYFDGVALTGATNSSLALSSVTRQQTGGYHVLVRNAQGEAVSEVAEVSFPLPQHLVAYYTDGRALSTGPAHSIEVAGLTPWRLEQAPREDLDLSGNYLLNISDNAGPSEALVETMPSVRAWVEAGGELVVHDRSAGNGQDPSPLLPGAEGVTLVRWNGSDLDPISTNLVVDGPFGQIDAWALDGGLDSFHGYAMRATLPAVAEPVLAVGSGSDSSRIVAFSYPLGKGHVYYASVPVDYFLEEVGQPSMSWMLREVYLPNVLVYVQNLPEGSAPRLTWGWRADGRVEVAWPIGRLQSAETVDGPWETVAGARSPYQASPNGDRRFFRVAQ